MTFVGFFVRKGEVADGWAVMRGLIISSANDVYFQLMGL